MSAQKMTKHEEFMRVCISLARNGKGHTAPNPLVGCVIVKNGKVLAEGYHKKYGALHAEADAIENAWKLGINIKGAAMYVNLEPCVHFGKTPPCTDRIIEAGIKEVFVGCLDPYSKVNGKGIAKLKKNGIKVTTGILEYASTELNKFFIKYVTAGLPYITLKAAQSIDGFIADSKYNSKWISSLASRTIAHKLRTEYDAVLVGKNTVVHDDPKLTVRHVKGRNPLRIVIDRNLSLGMKYHLFSDKFKTSTIVLTGRSAPKLKAQKLTKAGVTIIKVKSKGKSLDLRDAMIKLAALGISSIMVEGGAATFAEFLNARLADELIIFTAPKILGSGISTFGGAEKIDFAGAKEVYYQFIGNDILTNIKF